LVKNLESNFYAEKWNETTKRTFNLLKIATILFAVSLFLIWIRLLIRSIGIIDVYVYPGSSNYQVMLNVFMESYVEIPYVVSIFFVIALWGLSRQFEGRTKKMLGAAAILVAVPFLLDVLISTIGLILGNLLVDSEAGAFYWLFAMITSYNLMDIIFYQIAFFLLGIELWRMKNTFGLNTNMIFSSILGIILVPLTIATGVLFYFSLIALVISFWLQIIFYLIWAVNCLEFTVQLFRWKSLENKQLEKISDEYDSKVSIAITGDATKKIIIGGALLLLIYAGLWLIAQIVLMIKGDPFLSFTLYYETFMVIFLDLINVIEFFGIMILGYGLLLMLIHLKDERKDRKLLTSGTLLITTILIEAIITVIFAFYRFLDFPLYTFSRYNPEYTQWFVVVFEVLKSVGLVILGFALRDQRKLKNWKTNLLITPFLYMITVITLVILNVSQIINLRYDTGVQLATVLVSVAMVIELFIRVRNVKLSNQFEETNISLDNPRV